MRAAAIGALSQPGQGCNVLCALKVALTQSESLQHPDHTPPILVAREHAHEQEDAGREDVCRSRIHIVRAKDMIDRYTLESHLQGKQHAEAADA